MRRVALLLAALLLCPRLFAADLAAGLAAILDQPAFAQAQWGVKICSLDTGAEIFSRQPDKLLKPASNAKIYTAALALDRLGADFRIQTSCYAASAPDAQGAVRGDLIIYGRGDPSFSARFHHGDYGPALQPLVDALVQAGVKRIEGDLIGDDSYFTGPPYGADWTWDDLQNYYGAPVSALTYQDNVIDLAFKPGASVGDPCRIITMPETSFVIFSNRTQTVARGETRVRLYAPPREGAVYVWGQMASNASAHSDSVPVQNPALWFVTTLREQLARRGVVVSGQVRAVDWLSRQNQPLDLSHLVEIASAPSVPLAEIVKSTLKPSENLYAQLLLLQVGARHPSPERDTASSGLAEMRRFLDEAGIKNNSVLMQEGSGLSRSCLVTPAASVQLLAFMAHHRAKQAFFDALPVAGVDGTLRTRLKNTAAAGNVHAKTGSLQYVNTLSGYATNRAGAPLVFSIMLNNYHDDPGAPSGRAAIDSLVRLLVEAQ
ncbi:MAG TPA: D-alanyl-D-alanine carboxypeptidase/D-alanyl-D-alanine-endopeptidase [Verrucomicrobiae bacterium]|jgi:D-alanyl-D-alanine carboxypeptidase/D-alanyl-D-alanine-endopeptidase (penicillin-binding protein 4)|nr:D-alanyl-D-alanine carboxypeptidase/D-alanyl-D-alanine-endopeptidase [Verrucomicrobiae bacterium]